MLWIVWITPIRAGQATDTPVYAVCAPSWIAPRWWGRTKTGHTAYLGCAPAVHDWTEAVHSYPQGIGDNREDRGRRVSEAEGAS